MCIVECSLDWNEEWYSSPRGMLSVKALIAMWPHWHERVEQYCSHKLLSVRELTISVKNTIILVFMRVTMPIMRAITITIAMTVTITIAMTSTITIAMTVTIVIAIMVIITITITITIIVAVTDTSTIPL